MLQALIQHTGKQDNFMVAHNRFQQHLFPKEKQNTSPILCARDDTTEKDQEQNKEC